MVAQTWSMDSVVSTWTYTTTISFLLLQVPLFCVLCPECAGEEPWQWPADHWVHLGVLIYSFMTSITSVTSLHCSCTYFMKLFLVQLQLQRYPTHQWTAEGDQSQLQRWRDYQDYGFCWSVTVYYVCCKYIYIIYIPVYILLNSRYRKDKHPRPPHRTQPPQTVPILRLQQVSTSCTLFWSSCVPLSILI